MSTKHIRKIADLSGLALASGLSVRVVEQRTLGGYEAAKLGGGASAIAALAGPPGCARCGTKEAPLIILPPI